MARRRPGNAPNIEIASSGLLPDEDFWASSGLLGVGLTDRLATLARFEVFSVCLSQQVRRRTMRTFSIWHVVQLSIMESSVECEPVRKENMYGA